ncbi:MAG: hypothetical protein WC824_09020 [Bacteroidota bacterium]
MYRFGSLPLTKEEVLTQIHLLVDLLGHTPTCDRTSSRISGAANRFFGSWNTAMKEAGLEPNLQWSCRKHLNCRDGHFAESASEVLLDNWFHAQGISHERSKPYPEGHYTCDFYLPDSDLWVEYFGICGCPGYEETVEEKFRVASKHGIKLIGIRPEQIYPMSLKPEMFSVPPQQQT